jgi:hypothetical protein
VNALFLDGVFFVENSRPVKSTSNQISVGSPFLQIPGPSQNTCPSSCITQFNSAIASQKPIPTQQANSPTSTQVALTPSPTATPAPQKSVKEFFVPLGIGSGNAGDWTTIDGIGAYVDPADYGSIQNAKLELTVRVPTGNQTVWVRLYNANNYQTVPGTEMSMSGGAPTLLTSPAFTLPSGSDLYQIQMKTQLQYPAFIDMARLRIHTN